jgi:hypothetical protein
VAIVDPVTNLLPVGKPNDVRAMLMCVIDYLKVNEGQSIASGAARFAS